jgi:hypothetical protein
MHPHPEQQTVYLYLTDGGPIRFSHRDGPVLERPAVKAGAIRFARGGVETHSVESLTDIPSQYLRVELKTPLPTERTRDTKIPAEPAEDRTAQKTVFEDGQVRLVRVVCAAGETCPSSANPEDPALMVAMNAGEVSEAGAKRELRIGETLWLEPGSKGSWTVQGRTLQAVRIELKSRLAP